jgi:amino acid adenylation domain-containing protein
MISEKEKSSVVSKNIEAIYPLSPMQQGMLFHSLYAPESGVYVEQITFTLTGDLNVVAFESAWQTVVDRYSILRTLFIWENRPTPLQIVLKQVDLPWTNLDWLSLSSTAQQQQLSELLHTQRAQGFKLSQAPLMGCALIQLTDDTYQLIWNSHHILLDGWCLSIIFNEVLSFYEADIQGETCHLPKPVPYRDYITWLNAQDRAASTEFWRQNLHCFSAPTPLVVGRTVPQSHQPESNYRKLELRLSVDVSSKLQALAQQQHVTLSTIIQAAWGLLLSRYSSEPDIVFGVTVSGRTASLSGVENMVGLFINTLPLRLQISSDQQLLSWLEQIQQLTLELQQYSYTPLVEIQSLSDIPGGKPLFESIVVFENYPMDRSLANETGSLQVGEIETHGQTNFPLTVVAEPGDELSIRISYDTFRFTEGTIERMLGHLQTIFSAIATNPQQTVSELPLLTLTERHQLLVEWNNTSTEYPLNKCIHTLFEEQVERTPEAVAVVLENQQLTYRELNHRANQLAHYLQTQGVGVETLVGICVERSLEMVVGLLGILKAGGAYVPLDPNYPKERLAYMIADAQISLLLTQQQFVDEFRNLQAATICLDTDWSSKIATCDESVLVSETASENLAYVIYTSGSTGNPKGVMIEHRQLSDYFNSIQTVLDLPLGANYATVSTIAADLGNTVIFASLCSGGCLHIISNERITNTKELADYFKDNSIDCLKIVPSHLKALLTSEASSQILPRQRLVLGGESSSWELIEQVRQLAPECKIINHYGPTEATVGVLTNEVERVPDTRQSSTVPIGRPLANTQIYILDSNKQPVPIGVPGELHIGGDGLARGYLNRPELTAEKFIPNPFSDDSQARVYKTGDKARYLSDGNIEYLGRLDNQVKIRGFRIEMGEVEAVLSQYPNVKQTKVIAREDNTPGEQRLVAYLVVNVEQNPSTRELRQFLKPKLPDYMMPAAFVYLDTLPLTPNGKIDRRALPVPDLEQQLTVSFVAPRTQIEEMLAQMWADVLSIERVGIYDNFFELGGHSLFATQVMSRIRELFQIELPLQSLFEAATVSELADLAEEKLIEKIEKLSEEDL